MPKSYTDELAGWIKSREAKKPRRDLCTVSFLAVKDDIKAALDNGYSRKIIWEHMCESGKIQCAYQTFAKQIRKYITNEPEKTSPETPAKPKRASVQKPKQQKTSSFTFNPKPNKEELL